MRKKIILAVAISLILCGCSSIKNDTPKGEAYATQNRVSSIEYGIYANKQITVFINQITSRMGVCKNISEGFKADNEAKLANESLKIMKDTYDEYYTVYPPVGGEDDRDAVLTAMQAAIDHMEGYAKAVEGGESVTGYTKDFGNDFDQLTSLANLYYQ